MKKFGRYLWVFILIGMGFLVCRLTKSENQMLSNGLGNLSLYRSIPGIRWNSPKVIDFECRKICSLHAVNAISGLPLKNRNKEANVTLLPNRHKVHPSTIASASMFSLDNQNFHSTENEEEDLQSEDRNSQFDGSRSSFASQDRNAQNPDLPMAPPPCEDCSEEAPLDDYAGILFLLGVVLSGWKIMRVKQQLLIKM